MGGWLAMDVPAASATLPTSVRRPASASPAIRGAGQLLGPPTVRRMESLRDELRRSLRDYDRHSDTLGLLADGAEGAASGPAGPARPDHASAAATTGRRTGRAL